MNSLRNRTNYIYNVPILHLVIRTLCRSELLWLLLRIHVDVFVGREAQLFDAVVVEQIGQPMVLVLRVLVQLLLVVSLVFAAGCRRGRRRRRGRRSAVTDVMMLVLVLERLLVRLRRFFGRLMRHVHLFDDRFGHGVIVGVMLDRHVYANSE